MAKKARIKKGSGMQRLIGGAIKQALHDALMAEPVTLHSTVASPMKVFMLDDGSCYTAEAAIQKIGGRYSWWADV